MAKTQATQQAQTQTTERPAQTADEQRGKVIVAGWLDSPITFRPFEKEQEITLTPRRVKQFFCKPTKSGALCSDEHAMRFCQLCKSRGLDPWEGDAFIVGYASTMKSNQSRRQPNKRTRPDQSRRQRQWPTGTRPITQRSEQPRT